MKAKLSYLKVIVNSDPDRQKEDLLKVLHNWCWLKSFNKEQWPMFLFKQHNRDIYYCAAMGPEATKQDMDTPHMNPSERAGLIDVGFDAIVKRINDPEAVKPYLQVRKNLIEKYGE